MKFHQKTMIPQPCIPPACVPWKHKVKKNHTLCQLSNPRLHQANRDHKLQNRLFIEYPKCSTCQKAKKWLDENGFEYECRHIKEENPTYEELKEWYTKSGMPLKKFFNTSGLLYKSMQLKDKLGAVSEDEQLNLLATDGMLVKRPIIISDKAILTGFREKEWIEKLK